MRRVAVIGVGVTKFGRHDRTSAELFAAAAADAITDAGIAPSAIQALYFGNVTGGETERQLHMGPLAATLLGLPTVPTTRFENACATSHVAFRHAVMEIASGVSDVVLVGGAERVLNVPTDSATEFFAYCSDASLEQPAGLTFPGVFALIARAHMDKYGTTEEQMAHVAVKNHRHGALNPRRSSRRRSRSRPSSRAPTWRIPSSSSTAAHSPTGARRSCSRPRRSRAGIVARSGCSAATRPPTPCSCTRSATCPA